MTVLLSPAAPVFLLLIVASACWATTTEPDTLIDRLSRVPYNSPDYAFAQHQLAEHYLTLNTVRTRQKAETHVLQAIAREPHAIEHHVLLMKIQYARGFYWAAQETADKIRQMTPLLGSPYNESVAEAYYHIGLMAERSALKYRDMVSFSDNNVIYLSSYGTEDLLKAAESFEKALQFKRDHRDAIVHLGQLYFEIQNYDRMRMVFEYAVKIDPSDAEARCFLAMAYYYLGRQDLAEEHYAHAMTLMTSDDRQVYNSVEHILPDEQREMFSRLKGDERTNFEAAYWKFRDPMYLTASNERKLEQYNRITYANLRYGVPKKNMPGWRTEKGRIFIRYGKPVVSYKVQPDERILGGSENWQYDNFFFHFTDDFASGHYLLDDRSLLTERSVLKDRADAFVWPVEFSFDLKTRAFQFKGAGNETRLRVYYGAQIDDIDRDYRTFGLDVASDVGLFVIDDSNRITGEKRSFLEFNKDFEEGTMFINYAELDHIPVGTPVREYSMEVLTRMDRKAGIVREPIRIRSFKEDALAVSDVILASRITKERDLRVIPTFSQSVSRKSLVYLYFEIYHLTLNAYGNSAYRIETSFSPRDDDKWWKNWLPSWGRKKETITTAFDVAGRNRDDQYYFALDVRDLDTGPYTMHLRITDQLTNSSVTQSIPIDIEP
jgi:GWxTD domain-containing protein